MTASLLDTNILVYANNADSPFHVPCKALVEKAASGATKAAVSVQNLVELYAVITDKRRVERPLSPEKAMELVEFYNTHEHIQVIHSTSEAIHIMKELIARHKPTAQSIFDFLLVATMIENGISEIYTFNSNHFKPFHSITTLKPLSTSQ